MGGKQLRKKYRYNLKSAFVSARASTLASTIRDGAWSTLNRQYVMSTMVSDNQNLMIHIKMNCIGNILSSKIVHGCKNLLQY